MQEEPQHDLHGATVVQVPAILHTGVGHLDGQDRQESRDEPARAAYSERSIRAAPGRSAAAYLKLIAVQNEADLRDIVIAVLEESATEHCSDIQGMQERFLSGIKDDRKVVQLSLRVMYSIV